MLFGLSMLSLKLWRWMRCGRLFMISRISVGLVAIDYNTKVVLAYCFGTREHKYLDDLLVLGIGTKLFWVGSGCKDVVK
jgi:hypothetical protein